MALPLPLIWKLNLPQKQKFALSGIFLLGGFVTFSSIYRLVHLINLLKVSYDYPGFPYVTSVMWTVIEINMAIVSACLPMLRRLFEHAFKLRKSAKKVSDPVAKADDRPLNRAHSFERLHDPKTCGKPETARPSPSQALSLQSSEQQSRTNTSLRLPLM
ncbi:hypothetical protein MMC22_007419 [Lobaria immixta]|nr:hypothetical protein [Lobaria immixta]